MACWIAGHSFVDICKEQSIQIEEKLSASLPDILIDKDQIRQAINNLISSLDTDDSELILSFLERYDPGVKDYQDIVNDLIGKSIDYYKDIILPQKAYTKPDEQDILMFREL